MRVKTRAHARYKALDEVEAGTFEALVAVFNNVDRVGDRIMPGAFAKSLARWAESGDPIPVIWSHRWDDPQAHIGKVLDAAELDTGLWVRGQLDLDQPFAAQTYRLLKERRITQFSFSYEVPDDGERRGRDGANELLEVDLIEVGPILVGANRDTELLAVKSSRSLASSNPAKLRDRCERELRTLSLPSDPLLLQLELLELELDVLDVKVP